MESIKHKFQQDLNLDYVNWTVETLFIGTFNPDCIESKNDAKWFYGRTNLNMFWDTLGYIYENNPNLGAFGNPNQWIQFCENHKIAVTDLISEIHSLDLENGVDYNNICVGFSDKKLEQYINKKQIISVKIEELILNSNKLKHLKNVYLTRKGINSPWNKLWNPISKVCKVKNLNVKTLVTPGGFNYFQFNDLFSRTPENLAKLWQINV